ncbi:MAG TPA: right-handed parallel beta-helix repeat-containing protein [Azospirillaceae bacterium]|nr:right-handed parallel beta-helix repeat-containing protein [Azospirillaceae bacterium]
MATQNHVSITDFGAKGDGRTDNTAAIQRAFDHAKAHNVAVKVPAGTFLHNGTLKANSITIFGEGDASELRATSPGKSALHLRGDGMELLDLKLSCVDSGRHRTYDSAKVIVTSTNKFRIEDVTIEGSGSAGIIMDNVHNGVIRNNLVKNTNADSIHMVNESSHILVEKNRVERSGDDGISVVSYQKHGGVVKDIVIRDNVVMDNKWARGITVIGGENVQILNNEVKSPADRGGIYIASESAYSTFGTKNILVQGNHLVDAGGHKSGHGGITIYHSGKYPNQDIVVRDNHVEDSRQSSVLVWGNNNRNIKIVENDLNGAKTSGVQVIGPAKDLVVADNAYQDLKSGFIAYHKTGSATIHLAGNHAAQIPDGTRPTPAPTDPPRDPAGQIPPVVVGDGPDTIMLKVSGNAWNGRPEFQVAVDGHAVTAPMPVAVDEGAGWQTFLIKTDIAADAHALSVAFTNDLYGGAKGKDRNLSVGEVSVNGKVLWDDGRKLHSNGSVDMDLSGAPNHGPAPVPAPAPAQPPVSNEQVHASQVAATPAIHDSVPSAPAAPAPVFVPDSAPPDAFQEVHHIEGGQAA